MASQRGSLYSRDHTSSGPRIGLEQSASDSSQYHNVGQQVPGLLQPGRLGSMPINMSSDPSSSQGHSQDHPSNQARLSASTFSHNHTRSSPGLDNHGYSPFSPTTPSNNDQSQFNSQTSQKYTPQSSQRKISNTPLGLADIRPRADSGVSEGLPEVSSYLYEGSNPVPRNSSYLAPWALYAFDWCKWPGQSHDLNKVAVGSYLEDSQNYVRIFNRLSNIILFLHISSDSNTRLSIDAQPL